MPRIVDADKLHYKKVWITSVNKDGVSHTSPDVVVFAREIDKKSTVVESATYEHNCCTKCGAFIPTDSYRDAIFESDINYCYSCGAPINKSEV